MRYSPTCQTGPLESPCGQPATHHVSGGHWREFRVCTSCAEMVRRLDGAFDIHGKIEPIPTKPGKPPARHDRNGR